MIHRALQIVLLAPTNSSLQYALSHIPSQAPVLSTGL